MKNIFIVVPIVLNFVVDVFKNVIANKIGEWFTSPLALNSFSLLNSPSTQ